MNPLNQYLLTRLDNSKTKHRTLKPIVRYNSRFLTLETEKGYKEVLNFASNDYLGLSNLIIETEVISQPSSRILGGNLLHLEHLENEFAEFMNKESATIFQSGYTANLGLLSCLPSDKDLILVDKSIHASLIDGMRLSKAKWKRFQHNNLNKLESILKEQRQNHEAVWVVVESIYSMDGDASFLKDLIQLKSKYSFYIILDEAHSFGIYGKEGRGLANEQGLINDIDIMTFNFSKALALQGGIVIGPLALKPFLVNKCRPLIYSTATPWSHLSSLPLKLSELRIADHNREKLKEVSFYTQEKFNIKKEQWSPIIPIIIGDHEQTKQLAQKLLDNGIFCPAILPPTVPEGEARLRISLNSDHRKEDIDKIYTIITEDSSWKK